MRGEAWGCECALIHPGSTPICTHPGMCSTPWVHLGGPGVPLSQPGGAEAEGQEQCPCPCPCKELQTQPLAGETHCRDVSARFSLMAKAMALPPSSCSRLAAKLQGQRTQVTHEKLRTAPGTPQGGLGALLGPMGLTPAS